MRYSQGGKETRVPKPMKTLAFSPAVPIRLLPTDRPTHGAVGLPCCADRARRQLGLVAKRLSRIPDNSVKPTNNPSNPYSHHSAKSAITIRPVTTCPPLSWLGLASTKRRLLQAPGEKHSSQLTFRQSHT